MERDLDSKLSEDQTPGSACCDCLRGSVLRLCHDIREASRHRSQSSRFAYRRTALGTVALLSNLSPA